MKILKDSTYEALLHKQTELDQLRQEVESLRKEIKVAGQPIAVGPTASSRRDLPTNGFASLEASMKVIPAEFEFDVIPIIRKVAKVNPDMNQALNDFTRLANTGHKIKFDPSVGEAQVEAMRVFIEESSKTWHVGAAGMNGITNKMFRQAMIGGAISTEWVPNMGLDNVEEIRFVNPESIRFVIEKNSKGYQPYQKLYHRPIVNFGKELRKLNPGQYKYFALNGDTDLPYGTPPYLAALDPIATQKHMVDNIKFIVTLLGALGYVEAKMQKPNQDNGESDQAYLSRLQGILTQLKERVKQGLKDGVNVGFIDDHEFEFKQTAPSAAGLKDIFDQNELLVASGLNYDAVFMGRPGATETLVTVLFTKVLAQLKNIQDTVAANLEFGYSFALTLGGFKFKRLSVEFNRSTITDDLKYQQAQEVLIRNLEHLYDQGIIGQDQFADAMNYIKPDKAEPRITREKNDPEAALAKQKKEKGKDASDRKVRDKNKPQGTIRKSNNTSMDDDKGKIIAIN